LHIPVEQAVEILAATGVLARAIAFKASGILLSLEPAAAVVVGAIFLSQEIGLQAWLAVACTPFLSF
jgi:threonine/homoserine efflux transporter RhtA